MARTNKFGRTDYIPADVKRKVRQQCGFGCVNCGSPFYDYEHWNPTFEKLNSDPSPDGITLCCPSCHRIKGRLLSEEDYKNNIKEPFALKNGFVATNWSKGFAPEIILGNFKCFGGTRILEIDNQLMLGFTEPEDKDAPPNLIARFFDRNGDECFRIDNNQCIGNPNNWDIESTGIAKNGWRWIIRNGLRKIDLSLELYPPDKIVINKMLWHYGPLRVVVNENGVQLSLRQRDNSYKNMILIQNAAYVRALKPEHSFLSVKRKQQFIPPNTMNIVHNFEMNHIELNGGGTGKISFSPDEDLI